MIRSKLFLSLLLTVAAVSTLFIHMPSLIIVQGQSIPISQEYANGDIDVGGSGSPTLAWYAWVNVNGTHTIFLALHSYQYPSPIFSFVGQAYNASGSKIFVGNAMVAIEIYNDTDHNGYLDANYSTGSTELRYTVVMNASQTFTSSGVSKTIESGVPHYRWGITYGTIQAFLINALPPYYGYGGGASASTVTIDQLSMSYDFSVVGNTTFLKTSYHIGTLTLANRAVSLQGLSLSLLHSTLTVASKQLTVEAGSSAFNSQNNPSASTFSAAQVNVDNVLAYEFRFKDNYTLLSNPSAIYPAVYLASPIDSIPANAFQGTYFTPLSRVQQFVQGQLPDIAGLPSTSNLDYSATQFLYRINYPTWSGYAVEHDPTYVAHLSGGSTPISPGQTSPMLIVYAAVATGILALLVAFNGMRRKTKMAQPLDEHSDDGGLPPSGTLREFQGQEVSGLPWGPAGVE